MPASEASVSGTAVPAAQARGLTTGDEAAAIALAPLAENEGPIVGLIGDTGCGKTTAMLALIAEYQRRSPGIVLVAEDKGLTSRYPGVYRRDRAELQARPVTGDEAARGQRVIVFRGDIHANVDTNPEEVAAYAWELMHVRRPSLTVHDELARDEICKNMQWRGGVRWIPKSFRQGREVGVGTLWGCQMPQDAPQAAFDQSTAILCFRLTGLGLGKLRDRRYLDGSDVERVIPTLHAHGDPKETRGDFVLLERGRPWNGKVYKFRTS
jgi:hypothetical protein